MFFSVRYNDNRGQKWYYNTSNARLGNMRDRKIFEERLKTKDPKTLKGYRYTLVSFESFLGKRNLPADNAIFMK